jgi:hypothetical protein
MLIDRCSAMVTQKDKTKSENKTNKQSSKKNIEHTTTTRTHPIKRINGGHIPETANSIQSTSIQIPIAT